MHVTVRKTVVDWLQSPDHAPDVQIYVTGHSMGGALAAHCALDLKVWRIHWCCSYRQARCPLYLNGSASTI